LEAGGSGPNGRQREETSYGGVFGQTNKPALSKSQLKRRKRKVANAPCRSARLAAWVVGSRVEGAGGVGVFGVEQGRVGVV